MSGFRLIGIGCFLEDGGGSGDDLFAGIGMDSAFEDEDGGDFAGEIANDGDSAGFVAALFIDLGELGAKLLVTFGEVSSELFEGFVR